MMQEIADRVRYLAWLAFICTIFLGFIGASWGLMWWIALVLAVGGYLIATIDSTIQQVKEGIL